MAKIVNTKTGEVIYSDDDLNYYGVVEDFIEKNNSDYSVTIYECLSKLIKTMTGDASTPFNTVAELIHYIPDIMTATEETTIVELWADTVYYFVLPYDYEDDLNGWNKVLQTIYPEYSVIDD